MENLFSTVLKNGNIIWTQSLDMDIVHQCPLLSCVGLLA
jgi:hypothetical protein